ncbi:MAG: hypothetical protein C6Y20_11135 [Tagaea sp. CACIAM 22H2]|nr:hypothetical protein [Tagaea sp. CACIAM 22H2]
MYCCEIDTNLLVLFVAGISGQLPGSCIGRLVHSSRVPLVTSRDSIAKYDEIRFERFRERLNILDISGDLSRVDRSHIPD